MDTLKKTQEGYEFYSEECRRFGVSHSGNRTLDLCELARQVSKRGIEVSGESSIVSEGASPEERKIFYGQYLFERS